MASIVIAAPITFSANPQLKQFQFEDRLRITLSAEGIRDIADLRERLCIFDLSSTVWSDLGTLLWLISLFQRLRSQRNEVQIVFPEPIDQTREKFWDFLIRWRFFETLTACVDDALNLLRPDQVQYLGRTSQYGVAKGPNEFGIETALHSTRLLEITPIVDTLRSAKEKPEDAVFAKYTDRILVAALGQLCGWAPDETSRFVQLVIGEGVRNSVLHAQGSFSLIAMRLDPKNLTLAISDNGMGIPDTLRIAYQKAKTKSSVANRSDLELLKLFTEPEIVMESHIIKGAFREGTTSAEGRKGVGLFYLKNTVLEYKGTLRIRSGRACVDFQDGTEDGRDQMLSSPGTTLRITAPRRS